MKNILVLDLINDYLREIHVFMKMFEKKYGRTDILRAWREDVVSQSGMVSDEVEYNLHGIGCCIMFSNREVDFDFGQQNQTNGFDLWRLKKYLNNRADLKEQLSSDELEACFNEMIENGLIKKLYKNSTLYFLNPH